MGRESANCEIPQENQPSAFAATHLAVLIENNGDLVWSVDLNYRLVIFNNAFSERFRARLWSEDRRRNDSARSASARRKRHFSLPFYEKALREGPCSAGVSPRGRPLP